MSVFAGTPVQSVALRARPRAVRPAEESTQYSGYLKVLPLVDAVAFSVKRRYPATSTLDRANPNGKYNYVALLRLVVKKPAVSRGLARVVASVEMYDTWARHTGVYDYRDPACPPPCVVAAAKAAVPRTVVEDGLFFYDPADRHFYRAGPTSVTVESMLDEMYEKHCRTFRWQFRLRAAITTHSRRVRDHVMRRGRGVCVRAARALSAADTLHRRRAV